MYADEHLAVTVGYDFEVERHRVRLVNHGCGEHDCLHGFGRRCVSHLYLDLLRT